MSEKHFLIVFNDFDDIAFDFVQDFLNSMGYIWVSGATRITKPDCTIHGIIVEGEYKRVRYITDRVNLLTYLAGLREKDVIFIGADEYKELRKWLREGQRHGARQ